MAFFSGLKAAYDTLGTEITKTFDSSQDSQSSATEEAEKAKTTLEATTLGVADEVSDVKQSPLSTIRQPNVLCSVVLILLYSQGW